MKQRRLHKWQAVALIGIASAGTAFGAVSARAAEAGTMVFAGVNVIPMDTERVLENQTVVVTDGRIVALGPATEVAIPKGANIVEAQGSFLMPGLADMHVHVGDPDHLTLFVANGVTTIRNLNSTPEILAARDLVNSGGLLGPTIWAGRHISGIPANPIQIGPMTLPYRAAMDRIELALAPFFEINTPDIADGTVARNPRDAEILVRRAKDQGYDFIKTQWYMSRDTFDAMMAAAKAVGMQAIGHIAADIGVEHYISAGANPEHDYQLPAYYARDYVRQEGANPLDIFDFSDAEERLPELAALMLEKGVSFAPTHSVFDALDQVFANIDNLSEAPLFQQPQFRYVHPRVMAEWTNPRNEEFTIVMMVKGLSDISELIPSAEYRAEFIEKTRLQTKVLNDAGVPILAGSDSTDLGVVWGFAIHRELEILVEAGLSPYEALAAATRVPAEVVLRNPEEWGTVEVGKRADLVLLEANPLEDIRATRKIAGVMLRGQWLPRADLQLMLDEIAARYQSEAMAASSTK